MLKEADLCGARLNGANLQKSNLTGAKYNGETIWPDGFKPKEAGAELIGSA